MPRIRRKAHNKRDTEVPLSEWTASQLRAERKRLKTEPGDLNPWAVLKRGSEIENELNRRSHLQRAIE